MQNIDPVDFLVQLSLEGKNIQQLCETAEKKAEHIKAEEAKRRAEETETRRLKQIEDQKPCNWVPKWFFMRKVYPKEWLDYLQTHDLDELIVYAKELSVGQHVIEFRGNHDYALQAYVLLTAQINIRLAKLDPTQEKLRLLREAKIERTELKGQIEAIERAVEAVCTDANSIKSKLTPKQHVEATKAYAV